MKKRITQADWEYIGKYNPAAKWLRDLLLLILWKKLKMVSVETATFLGWYI